jgi:hypothetical protein
MLKSEKMVTSRQKHLDDPSAAKMKFREEEKRNSALENDRMSTSTLYELQVPVAQCEHTVMQLLMVGFSGVVLPAMAAAELPLSARRQRVRALSPPGRKASSSF